MSDAMDALRLPIEPVDPDPEFAARLRRRLENALLDTTTTTIPRGGPTTMPDTTTTKPRQISAELLGWGPTLTPYIMVADARRAIDWYIDVFGGHQRGDVYANEDGTIGHAEIGIGDGVLMLSEPSDLWPDIPVAPPPADPGPHSHTMHVQVEDVDETVRRAADNGASVEREPADQPYGRVAVIVDPFGHRWYLNRPPRSATRANHGDVAYITLTTPDDERAKAFYAAVLGWEYSPGNVERGWQIEDRRPMIGIGGDPNAAPGASLCYRVADMTAALERVRAAGGEAGDPQPRPYGLLAECADDQGADFWLWQPTD